MLVEELIGQLEPENVVDILMTAECYMEQKLKEESLKFIVQNLENVINTMSFERPEVPKSLLVNVLIVVNFDSNIVIVNTSSAFNKGLRVLSYG